jgi:hypothetical protein
LAPATLTAEAGFPTRASASVATSTAAGTARLNAAAEPRKEKAFRREISSKLSLSLMAISCPLGCLTQLLQQLVQNVAPSFSSVAKTENPSAIAIVTVQMVIHIDLTSLDNPAHFMAQKY